MARGSSDYAAHYAGYLIMARPGRLVTSLPMSLVTLYQSQIACRGLATFAFSQSGQSPDLVEPTRYFSGGGAITLVTRPPVTTVIDETAALARRPARRPATRWA